MKHPVTRLIAIILLAVSLGLGIAHQAHATSLDSFSIESFTQDLYLGRDDDNRSTLKTTEVIVAKFPDFNQNHGIERAIPNSYQGHSTYLKITSITDQNGKAWNYTTRNEGNMTIVRIGDADTFVKGVQSYNLSYTQRDVTQYFENTKSDEFYWDTNGTAWRVPIYNFRTTVHFEDGLFNKLSGNQSCYQGISASKTSCDLAQISNGYRATAALLSPGENITVAFGFPAGTFAAHKDSFSEKFAKYAALMAILSLPLGIISVVLLIFRYQRLSMRKRDRTTVIPEYLPPKDTSVTVSANIYNTHTAVFGAQMIDFAVRHYIKIYQTSEKSFFRSAKYEIEIIKDISDLQNEEQEIFRDIFPATTVDTRLDMSSLKGNTSLYAKIQDNAAKLTKDIKGKYDLRAADPAASSWFRRTALVMVILAVPLLSFWVAAAALVSFIMSYTLAPLTDKGLQLYQYLEGLKLYIKTAEADRIRMLQSPEGAAKVGAPIDTNDGRQMVKLYERVLPYAILFGFEKQWNAELGKYYEQITAQPDWYSSHNTVFNAAVFSAAMNDFNTTASYSSGAASSSSGGSSGGGSSGGGGGGGGGGGW